MSGGGVEIERKYLLPGEPPARVLESATAYEIDQTYLTASTGSRRVRRRVGPDGERFWLTEKQSRGGITRSEDERELIGGRVPRPARRGRPAVGHRRQDPARDRARHAD